MRRPSRRVALVAVSAWSVTAVACGGSSDDTVTSSAGTPADATTPSVEPTTTTISPTSTTSAPTTTVVPTTAAAPTTGPEVTTTPPGEPVDWLVAGTRAQVAGVAFDETFTIRVLPGDDQSVAALLPPLTELVLTGNGRDLDQGDFFVTWAEVAGGGATGWISAWSLVYLGAPRDATAEAVSAFGQLPTAPTMLELGAMVMDELAPLDPDSAGAERVRATEPGAGPTSDVVYDEFPGEEYGDDAALGARYRVTGRQATASELPPTSVGSPLVYELVSIEVRSLCTRGVDAATGVCI